MDNILLFGDNKITQIVGTFLGNTSHSQSAMVYFEFPNSNFSNSQILDGFTHKLKMMMLQPAFLPSVIAPKRELNEAELMVWVFDWNDLDSLVSNYGYLKKIVQNRKSFLPLMILGVRAEIKEISNPGLRFLNLFRFRKLLEQMIQLPVHYFEFTANKNEWILINQLRDIIKNLDSSHSWIKKYSTITLDELLKSIESFLLQIQDETIDFAFLLPELLALERKLQYPISRRYLEMNYGCMPQAAREIMDKWESLAPDFTPDDMKNLDLKAQEIYNMCLNSDQQPNYPNLIGMGFDSNEVKKLLRYLLEKRLIPNISQHIVSQEYIEYHNIHEVIVLYEGRTLFVKSTTTDIDHTQLFSGMIQAIELVRNEYLTLSEGNHKTITEGVEGLEFGDLRAYIGNGAKGVKLILRLNDRPLRENIFRNRVQSFLKMYENEIPLNNSIDLSMQKTIRELSERIFYQNFNPFPISFNVFKKISLVKVEDFSMKTIIEQAILKILQQQGALLLEDLVEKVSESFHGVFARSDLFTPIFDLIEEKIIM